MWIVILACKQWEVTLFDPGRQLVKIAILPILLWSNGKTILTYYTNRQMATLIQDLIKLSGSFRGKWPRLVNFLVGLLSY